MDIEYKDVTGELKSLNAKGEGILKFIKFHQEDKDSDITLPGFIGRQEAILISAHNWRSDYPPVGRGESFEDEDGTLFRFSMNMDDSRAQSWYSWLTMDRKFPNPLQQVSYGFSPHPDAVEPWHKNGKAGRYLKPRPDGPGAKLHEISFVTVGSGNDQGVLDLKSVHPSPTTRHYWPGGLPPMKSHKEHVSAAVTSLWAGMRHLHQVRLELARSPSAVKSDPAFTVAFEHIETALDSLNEVLVMPVELSPQTVPLPPALPGPSKAAEPSPDVSGNPSVHEPSEPAAQEGTDIEEKGGVPIHEDLEAVMRSIEQVTDRLEQIKSKRAEVSPRYPNGRPMSTERLGQVDALQARLSRLKVSAELNEQQQVEQQELHDMTERLKRLGVAV